MICHPVPPKRDHWAILWAKRILGLVFGWLKNPFGMLKFLAGYLALAAFCVVLVGVALDYRKYRQEDGAATSLSDKRLKYNFECSPQISESGFKKIADADSRAAVPIDLRYYLLMESARKRTEPYNLSGKLNRFSLCANPTRLGFGGIEVAHSANSTFNDSWLPVEVAQIRAGEFEKLVSLYSDFPTDVSSQARCLLSNLSKGHETMGQYEKCEEGEDAVPAEEVIQPGGDGTYTVSTFDVLGKEAHAIVVGADKENDPAIHQVELARFILENKDTEIFVREGWLRTVSFYRTKELADTALNERKHALPFGGYVVRISTYCKGIEKEGFETTKGVRFWACEN